MKMRDKFLKLAGLGIVCVLARSHLTFAGPQRISLMASDERAIRSLITRWVGAFNDLDAKRLAALETPDVQAVDRFGVLHLSSGRSENEKLWADSFEVVSRNTTPPVVTIDHIRLIRPEVAVVQASWRFAEGILLVDGDRVPPFSQIDTYVVIKSQDSWLVAAHNMQEKKP
jgi:uncharacterized protein (TIGR02246 family)